ncbi:MAG: HAD family hydrolase [Gammaproteobacteria bacterium]|nr:HAD family hydrolase [Gammaproteobacteria bacterium]NNE06846.1 HAD family hydrolase [Xanthomonadales bacterium]
MTGIDPLLLERAANIRLLALDVDGVLTDGKLYFDSQGNEMKAFNTRDGLGIKALQRCGITLALITGRESAMVSQRARQLGIEHVYQGRDDKLNAYMDLLSRTGIEESAVCYAGDDWIDLPVLMRCGLAVTVPSADEEVRGRVHWVTSRAGGEGAVREICELILTAQGRREELLREVLSS